MHGVALILMTLGKLIGSTGITAAFLLSLKVVEVLQEKLFPRHDNETVKFMHNSKQWIYAACFILYLVNEIWVNLTGDSSALPDL